MTYARPLLRLLESLGKLPGIGPRSAERIAFYLLRISKEQSDQLAQAVLDVKSQLRFCEICFNVSEAARCGVCEDAARDPSTICVVEEPKDVLAIEKTGMYRGLYHVLLGAIAPLDGVGPELLKIEELVRRVAASEGTIREILLATDVDKDGETTASYIAKLLRAHPVKLTRLASGLPVGGHLEYADHATLARAVEGRRELPI